MATFVLWLTNAVWNWASIAANGKVAKRITRNRRNLTIIIVGIVLILFAAAVYSLGAILTQTSVMILSVICIATIGWHLLSELNAFWSIGFNYIEQTVSKTTYRDAMMETFSSFHILGTNAFNLVRLAEFEEMAKRIRENNGELRMVLAHPDSEGLKEAARGRRKSANIYRDQAMFSLGMLLNLGERLGLSIDVRTYWANNIEELPIFRIMLINMSQAVAAISVYGREDHGRSLPQFYAYKLPNANKAPRSMYSVLCRYFSYFYDKSISIPPMDRDRFVRYWYRCRNNPEQLCRLEG